MTNAPARGRGRPRRPEADAEILEAALALLREGGYRALSLDEVARRAGTAKSSIYRRWPSKAALVAELVRTHTPEVHEPSDDAFEALMRGPFGPAVASLVGESFDSAETRAIMVSLLEPYRRPGDDERDQRIAATLFRTLLAG